jgi:hypothetical protein
MFSRWMCRIIAYHPFVVTEPTTNIEAGIRPADGAWGPLNVAPARSLLLDHPSSTMRRRFSSQTQFGYPSL